MPLDAIGAALQIRELPHFAVRRRGTVPKFNQAV
jgi:hypothetical protein